MVKVYGYTKCSTVKKALKFLDERGVKYEHIDNVVEKLTADEIKNMHQLSGLEVKRFFNTSGMLYREMGLKDVVKDIENDAAYELLATDGMLVKRPIMFDTKNVLVGFKLNEWEELF